MKPKQTINKVNWNEQFKIRVRRNASRKHETIKLLIVLNIIEKFKKNLSLIRVYTEYEVGDGKICDVYFENIKTNEIICYEIQNNISKKWLEYTKEFYENYDKIFFTVDWMLVREKDLPESIEELNKAIKDILI